MFTREFAVLRRLPWLFTRELALFAMYYRTILSHRVHEFDIVHDHVFIQWFIGTVTVPFLGVHVSDIRCTVRLHPCRHVCPVDESRKWDVVECVNISLDVTPDFVIDIF